MLLYQYSTIARRGRRYREGCGGNCEKDANSGPPCHQRIRILRSVALFRSAQIVNSNDSYEFFLQLVDATVHISRVVVRADTWMRRWKNFEVLRDCPGRLQTFHHRLHCKYIQDSSSHSRQICNRNCKLICAISMCGEGRMQEMLKEDRMADRR
jgi:hypothetical protein